MCEIVLNLYQNILNILLIMTYYYMSLALVVSREVLLVRDVRGISRADRLRRRRDVHH